MKVIFNGSLIENTDEMFSQEGWLKGSGFFETIKTVDGRPWALARHMRRAVNSARTLGFRLPNEEVVRGCVSQILQLNNFEQGMMRISFSSNGDWGIFHTPYQEKNNPASVTVFSHEIVEEGVPLKTYPYSHRLEILREVNSKGFDEAIVINQMNKVCEGSVTNLLFKIDATWITPPLSDGVLPGVMRALVIENLEVQVRSITVQEIPRVESGFLLSSLRIAQPISAIEGRELIHSHEFEAEIRAMALRTSVG